MGIKKLPNRRLYWSRGEALFHCQLILQILKRDRFESITRCLHLCIALAKVQDRKSPSYDKLHKVRWLVDDICSNFQALWSPNQQVSVDESMVMYKGKYSPIRQYMPNKPVRFGLKVWVAADAVSKYVWKFQIYYGRSGNPHDDASECSGSEDEEEPLQDIPV